MNSTPNLALVALSISEARDYQKVDKIARSFEHIPEIVLFEVVPNTRFNRTKIIFGGPPAALFEAARATCLRAAELIDLRKHDGDHHRIGAIDMISFLPLQKIDLPGVVDLARKFAGDISKELNLPIYLTGFAALKESRNNIAFLNSIGLSDLEKFMNSPEGRPDIGPLSLNPGLGACIIGTRCHYITFAMYFETDEVEYIEELARIYTTSASYETGGELKKTGWRLRRKSEKLKQLEGVRTFVNYFRGDKNVSLLCKINNYCQTPIHLVYDFFRREAENLGIMVVGSKIIGFIPAEALILSGKHYFRGKDTASETDEHFINLAIQRMRCNAIEAFDYSRQIINRHFVAVAE